MLRVLKILEMAWLLIGVFSMVAGAYFFNQQGWDASKWFFGGALVAGIFFAFRKRQRLKFEDSKKENPNN
jgi:uncharacterized membrane protein